MKNSQKIIIPNGFIARLQKESFFGKTHTENTSGLEEVCGKLSQNHTPII
jgi:hypothetical protein